MLDTHAQNIFDKNINMMVPYYIMAAYAYYKDDDPIFSDAFFDNMSKIMLDEWMNIYHYHKDLITIEDLKGGTYLGKYPSIVRGALKNLRVVQNERPVN
jgi:hypothetical protein